jgi:hypothetical protein
MEKLPRASLATRRPLRPRQKPAFLALPIEQALIQLNPSDVESIGTLLQFAGFPTNIIIARAWLAPAAALPATR